MINPQLAIIVALTYCFFTAGCATKINNEHTFIQSERETRVAEASHDNDLPLKEFTAGSKVFIPRASLLRGYLLTGATVAKNEESTLVIQVVSAIMLHDTSGEYKFKGRIIGSMGMSEGINDRITVKITKITVVGSNGVYHDIDIDGFVVAEDGLAGLSVITKNESAPGSKPSEDSVTIRNGQRLAVCLTSPITIDKF